MNYLWTTIHVNNLERSIAFYSDTAELKVLQRFPAGPGIEIAFMGNEINQETQIELYADNKEATIQHENALALGFEVNSVTETINIFKKKDIAIDKEPFETPKFKWFSVKDPDGLTIQFFEKK